MSLRLDHAKALHDWTSCHGEGLEQIKACGNHFDLESCALISKKVPGVARPLNHRLDDAQQVHCAALYC